MERRQFLGSALGTTLMAASASVIGMQQAGGGAATPEVYLWRQYLLKTGKEPRRLADFLQNAAIPALNRLGHRPIGVFEVVFGLATPGVFMLVPGASIERLGGIEAGLDKDAEFLKSAESYLAAPAEDPVYTRQETSLLGAFPNVPRVEVPAATASNGPRLFELRTYESHSERAHRM